MTRSLDLLIAAWVVWVVGFAWIIYAVRKFPPED
jgi:hypothetical protein